MLQLLFAVLAFAAIPDGLYQQACQEGYRRSEVVKADQAIYLEENFADPACHLPSLEIRSYGEIYYGVSVAEPFGAIALDFHFNRVTLTPRSVSVARIYTERNLCGISTWATDVEQEITGRHCDFFGIGTFTGVPKLGDVRYGVYRINSESSISFGALSPERNGSTPNRRPRYWDGNAYFLVK